MGSAMVPQQVEFESRDGTTLRGVLHRPDRSGLLPGVVMSHGFSAVKEMGLPAYADAIADGGSAVLVYDHRGFGASGGEPRQQINPWLQMSDMQDALTWLGERADVDAQRLGLWGSSFSGGEVLVLAATDDRVRAVVANVPFAGTPGETYDSDTTEIVEEIRRVLAEGSLADCPAASVMGPFAVVREADTELRVFLDQPESAEWFSTAGSGTAWRNEVTLANAFGSVPPFDPGACAAHIRCPVLFVVASEDRVAEAGIARAAHERAPNPKRLVIIDGHHFTPYAGEALSESAEAASSWFAEHL